MDQIEIKQKTITVLNRNEWGGVQQETVRDAQSALVVLCS